MLLFAVGLPRPAPSCVDDYTEVFGSPVHVDAAVASFDVDPSVLTAPVVQTEESWLEYIHRAPYDIALGVLVLQ